MRFQAVNQWPDETRRSRYPFVETASLRDVSGLISLEDALVLECQIWPAVASYSRYYISSVERTPAKLTIQVSSLDEVLGTATVETMTKVRAAFLSSSGAQIGFIRVAPGGFARLHSNPSASYRFSVTSSELVPSAVHARPTGGLSGISVGGTVLSGDIRLVGGEGTRLRVVNGVVKVDYIGNPYFSRDGCKDAQQLGLAINPVRKLVVSDGLQTYAVVPQNGQVGVAVVSAEDRALDERSVVSPGPNGEVLATLLPT